jgi:hypothetical protein
VEVVFNRHGDDLVLRVNKGVQVFRAVPARTSPRCASIR